MLRQRLGNFDGRLSDWSKGIPMEFETIVLSLGLRYDVFNPRAQYLTNPFVSTSWTSPDIQHVLSPRVGIAYPVLENMVFHFSYGQFFQRPEFQAMYEDLGRRFGVSEPIFGVPGLRPEKTASYEFGVTATVAEHATTQLTFFSKKIQDLIGLLWTYQPLAYATYVNEDFASVKGFEWSGRVRWSNLSASLNYTYSIAEGSSSSQEERYAGAFDVVGTQSLRFLPLDFDQRQTLNGNCAVEFDTNEGPFGFLPIVFENTSANLLATYGSGLPYTFNPLRARYVPDQNNSRLPANITIDLLVQKEFRIDPVRIALFADIRNLFDRKNVRSVYGATGSPVVSGSDLLGSTPDYNQDPTNYFPPRTIYLGVTVSY